MQVALLWWCGGGGGLQSFESCARGRCAQQSIRQAGSCPRPGAAGVLPGSHPPTRRLRQVEHPQGRQQGAPSLHAGLGGGAQRIVRQQRAALDDELLQRGAAWAAGLLQQHLPHHLIQARGLGADLQQQQQ